MMSIKFLPEQTNKYNFHTGSVVAQVIQLINEENKKEKRTDSESGSAEY